MTILFLHGGGDNSDYRAQTFGRFAQAALSQPTDTFALVMADHTLAQAEVGITPYLNIFTALSIPTSQIQLVHVCPEAPLTAAHFANSSPTGVFICGGLTPVYQQSLCIDRSWVKWLKARQIPYGGTSAGAAIAAEMAILGGWLATYNQRTRPILFQGASEGLDPLTARPGLALAPFAIDVHASQMGTLTRLIHAVSLGLVIDGWAIDENTLLVVGQSNISLYGQGQAYHIHRQENGEINISIHSA